MSYGAGSFIGTAHSSGTHIRTGLNPSFRQTHTIRSMAPNQAFDNGNGNKQAITETCHNASGNLTSSTIGIAKASGVFDMATVCNYRMKNNWARIPGVDFYQENYGDFSAKRWQFSSHDNDSKLYGTNQNFGQYNDAYKIQSWRFFTTDTTKYRIFVGFWIPGNTAFYHDLCIGAIQIVDPGEGTTGPVRTYAMGSMQDNSDMLTLMTSQDSANWTVFGNSQVISSGLTLNSTSYQWDHTIPDNFTAVTAFQNTANQWNIGNFTNSGYTGANSGISLSYGTSQTNTLPFKDQAGTQNNGFGPQIPQTITNNFEINTNFLFFESSSPAARFDIGGFYTPRITLLPHKLYSLRIAYMFMTRAGQNASNQMWAEVVPVQETYRT